MPLQKPQRLVAPINRIASKVNLDLRGVKWTLELASRDPQKEQPVLRDRTMQQRRHRPTSMLIGPRAARCVTNQGKAQGFTIYRPLDD